MSKTTTARRSALGVLLAGALTLGLVSAAGSTAHAAETPPSTAGSNNQTQDKGSSGQGTSAAEGQARLAAAPTLTRGQVLARAESWVGLGLVYNQSGFYGGYRRDCSGYASMAWGLAKPGLATPYFGSSGATTDISKGALQPGDALLNKKPGNSGHIVIFAGWSDASRTSYMGYEFSSSGVHHRVVPYPYFPGHDEGSYVPVHANNV
ncbi:hypothetical protein ACWCPW_51875, partial [Embleya sp. NPDC001921]